ncbi:MAG: hypothetical protein KJ070_04070 [Verrucomicrobia bacterium]|nr:hypothetical protein [Verrucomicrobiota bacterium]
MGGAPEQGTEGTIQVALLDDEPERFRILLQLLLQRGTRSRVERFIQKRGQLILRDHDG